MEARRRPLSPRERRELAGIVSPGTAIGRAAVFLVAVWLFGLLCRSLNGLTPAVQWWPYPVVAGAMALVLVAKKMTGGPELRRQIREDLANGEIEERAYTLEYAVIFPEEEDEGPVWFFRTAGKTYCLCGQDVARLTRDGQPRTKLFLSVTVASGRILKMKVAGEKPAMRVSPVPFFSSPAYNPKFRKERFQEVPVDLDQLAAGIPSAPGAGG